MLVLLLFVCFLVDWYKIRVSQHLIHKYALAVLALSSMVNEILNPQSELDFDSSYSTSHNYIEVPLSAEPQPFSQSTK